MIPSRRQWLARAGLLASGSLLSPLLLAGASTQRPVAPVGPLGEPDALGVRLPAGFKARLVARTGQLMPGSGYRWHPAPDGGATFATADGGWIYVSNAELPDGAGGAAALRFDAGGGIRDAYSILRGTNRNCAGGPTPWGTWLSGEEVEGGLIHECDPTRPGQGLARPLLGTFNHEAAAVDPVTGDVYLTEDHMEGRLYRFRSRVRGVLDEGVLEAAQLGPDTRVRWIPVSSTAPCRDPETAPFQRGEGVWHAGGHIYFSTTHDHRVWAYSLADSRLAVIYDAARLGGAAVLRWPDNLTVHPGDGSLLVAEDGDDMQLNLLLEGPEGWSVSPLVQFVGHDSSEVTGPAFSPDGTRLYLSSQRGRDGKTGMTFEITGPFA